MKNQIKTLKPYSKPNSYHTVTLSPWPLGTTISISAIILSIVFITENLPGSKQMCIISIIAGGYSIYNWFNDIIIEGTYQGEHTIKIQKGLTLGFILFVLSEVCVFFGLFFAYLYNALIPAIDVGGVWPPIGIIAMNWKSIPLFNTIILLLSGVTITICQNEILSNNLLSSKNFLFLTMALGFIFLFFQYFEYKWAPFTISDSVFGSSFFILTGCHGLHIIIGLSFLFFTFFRLFHFSFSSLHHLQFSLAAIYWHFLDAVWLLLFLFLYIWAF